MKLKYGILLAIYILLLLSGLRFSFIEYYYSYQLWIFGAVFALLMIFFFQLKPWLLPLLKHQVIGVIILSSILIFTWYVVPHFRRFGIYPFALFGFLYTGTIIYHSGGKRQKILLILCFLSAILNVLPLVFYISERTMVSRPLINTLFISDINESMEYMRGKINSLHLLAFTIFFMAAAMLFIRSRRVPPQVRITNSLLRYFLTSYLVVMSTGPVGALLSEYLIFRTDRKIMTQMVVDRKSGSTHQKFSFTTKGDEAQKVLIIIGESLNRKMMSLYGYPLPTTPLLEKLVADSTKGKTYQFNDVISPEAMTVLSLRKVLTNINNTNKLTFSKCVTLVDLFKAGGYETFWLSNQAIAGKHDSPNSLFANTADHYFFTASHTRFSMISSRTHYDSELLPELKSRIKPNRKAKQVFFLHLMGSHFYYNERYPDKFDRFRSTKNGDTSSYLNTVYYNDYVVSQLFRMAQSSHFDVVCYLSDHGEDLEKQHNMEKYTRDMSTIPLLVYLSPQYASTHPELAYQLYKNKNTPAMTDNFFHDIHLICGFGSSLFEPSNSFLSPAYTIKKRRVVNNTIPFD